jgi:hypothetical protein
LVCCDACSLGVCATFGARGVFGAAAGVAATAAAAGGGCSACADGADRSIGAALFSAMLAPNDGKRVCATGAAGATVNRGDAGTGDDSGDCIDVTSLVLRMSARRRPPVPEAATGVVLEMGVATCGTANGPELVAATAAAAGG